MKLIYILLIIALVNLSAVLAIHYYKIQQSSDFLEYGQYQPMMMMLDDDQMLTICETYDLTYDYEERICK